MDQLTKQQQLDMFIREWTHPSLSSRPEFYSGRGVMECDLNDQQLIQIYKGIRKEYGQKESFAYIEMVKNLPLLTATDFLISLKNLVNSDFESEIVNEGGISIPKDENGEYGDSSLVGGFLSFMGAMSRDSERDKQLSDRIKRGFFYMVGQCLQKEDFSGKEEYLRALNEEQRNYPVRDVYGRYSHGY